MDSQNILKCLCEAVGISGYEDSVRFQVKQQLENCPDLQLYIDKIGNLVCYKKGIESDTKLMITAHMDEVGFQVMQLENGNALLKPMGNIKTWNAFNQLVATSDKEKTGIIFCDDPDGIKPYEFEKLKAIPLRGEFKIGDTLGFDFQLIDTGKQWIGKAIDNRISCFILCEILKSGIASKNDVYFIFTTQEETGMRGARVAATSLNPDIIINMDVSPIGKRNSLKMGDGVGIKLSDSIGVSSQNLVYQLENYATNCGINYQREVSDCGTTELIITNEKDSGAERVGISIPCENMHTSLTKVEKKDVFASKQLLEVIIKNGLQKNVVT